MDEKKERMKGYCKWFNKSGWGFIVGADEKSYFAHYSEVQKIGFKSLAEGELVNFIPDENEKGLLAKNIISE